MSLGPLPSLQGILVTFLKLITSILRHHTEANQEDIELADEVLEFYVGSRGDINEAHRSNLTDMISDAFFWYGIETFLTKHIQHSQGRSYQYIIEHKVSLLAAMCFSEPLKPSGTLPFAYCTWA